MTGLLRGLSAERQALVDEVLWERKVKHLPRALERIENDRIARDLDAVLADIGGPGIHRYSGADIRTVRLALGLTLRQLSGLLGTSITAVYAWEHEHRNPSPLNQASITAFMRTARNRLRENRMREMK